MTISGLLPFIWEQVRTGVGEIIQKRKILIEMSNEHSSI